jgi:DEAD/DEAH box helicase domain-containing protein
MNYVVFDIETQNTFEEVGSSKPEDLDISVVSIYDSESDCTKSFTQENLNQAWNLFEKSDFIVGYNSNHFDIPILNKYYKKNNFTDLNNIKSIDLLESIKNSFGKRVKLDDIANATLGRNKIAHGLEAVMWWKQGKIDEIIKYCEEDVIITHQVFLFAKNNGFLKLKDKFKDKVIEIKIDTSEWKLEEKKEKPLSLF